MGQAKELAERGIFVGELAGRAQDQTVGHAPSPRQDARTAVPLHHRTALSEPQPPMAPPPHDPPTFYALPTLIPTPPTPPESQAPVFFCERGICMEAHLHNAAQMAQQAERHRMEESLPLDLRDSL